MRRTTGVISWVYAPPFAGTALVSKNRSSCLESVAAPDTGAHASDTATVAARETLISLGAEEGRPRVNPANRRGHPSPTDVQHVDPAVTVQVVEHWRILLQGMG